MRKAVACSANQYIAQRKHDHLQDSGMNIKNTGSMLLPYRHPVVRDLAWVMISPGLLHAAPEGQALVTDDWCRCIYALHENHLRELDENPAPLLDVLSKNKNHRLGVYFECLLHYWLNTIMHVQQLQHNVPVFQQQKTGGQRTLGEFDFLFWIGEKQRVQHWEVTVKFYLQKKNAEGALCWMGPGDRDRFDIKLNRLFQHQLRLANFPEAQELLKRTGSGLVQSAAFIKGYLFYRLDEAGERAFVYDAVALAPCVLSANHHRGWWLHWKEMPMLFMTADVRWMVLPKLRWLSPVCCYEQMEEVLMETRALWTYCETHFRHQDSPLLVVALRWQSTVWQEVSRGFILSSD